MHSCCSILFIELSGLIQNSKWFQKLFENEVGKLFWKKKSQFFVPPSLSLIRPAGPFLQKSPRVPIKWQHSPFHYSLLSLTLALNPFVYFKFTSRRPWSELTEPRPRRPNVGEHQPRRHTPASPWASTCHAQRIEVTHAQNGAPRRHGHTLRRWLAAVARRRRNHQFECLKYYLVTTSRLR